MIALHFYQNIFYYDYLFRYFELAYSKSEQPKPTRNVYKQTTINQRIPRKLGLNSKSEKPISTTRIVYKQFKPILVITRPKKLELYLKEEGSTIEL